MKEIKDLKLQEVSKLKELNQADLKKELESALKKSFTLQMKKNLGELKQTHLVTFLRKYVAKIKTIASEKGFNIG
jgi:large subunit ribosomal protein L29